VGLKVYGRRRLFNLVIMSLSLAVISGAIAWNNIKRNHSVPINVEVLALVLGVLVCLLPLSEEWVYLPWQDAPRKIEHESRD